MWKPGSLSGAARRRLWLLTLLLLAGAAPRIAPLTDYRFHADEALFATLARLIISGQDPLLASTTLLVDKPPLFYHLLALGLSISWGSELSARLPGLFASLISLALVARLAAHTARTPGAPALALLFLALSPFAILFSPTAFADPQLVMWTLAALTAVTGRGGALRRWGLAGLFLGLAVATKQNGLFMAPLVIALGAARSIRRQTRLPEAGGWLLAFCGGLLPAAALMIGWEALRGVSPGFWAAGLAANNPGRLAAPAELWPRAVGWLSWLRCVTGWGVLNALLVLLAAVLLGREIRERPLSRSGVYTLLIAGFAAAYLAAHWLIAFPLLDRYLLPLVPLAALLVARAPGRLTPHRPRAPLIGGLLLTALLAVPALRGAGGCPVGGDHGAHDGIDQVGALLSTLPEGSVVYTDTLGWLLAYYAFDAPVYHAAFDSPAALATDLRAFGHDGTVRVLALAGGASHTGTLQAVQEAGFEAELILSTDSRSGETSFVVYRLRPGP